MGKNTLMSLGLRRFTAIFLSLSLTLLNSLSYAQVPAEETRVSRFPLVGEAPRQMLPKDLAKWSLPAELGAIQEFYRGSSDKTVIYLQDAHTLYEAQKSIQGIIDFFQKNYGLDLVALEGGTGKLDPFLFRVYPDAKTLKQVFNHYLEKGELSGAVATAVLNPKQADYYGIEDKELFEEGILAFLEAQRFKPGLLRALRQQQKTLDLEKEKVYSRELLELDRAVDAFENRKLDLAPLLVKLESLQPPAGLPYLQALMKEMKEEGVEIQSRTQIEI